MRGRRRGGPLRRWRPFLVGALVSGGPGLLYAPRPGAALRAQVRQAAGPLQERATQLTTQAKERVGALQGQAQEQLGQVRARAQSGAAPARGGTAG